MHATFPVSNQAAFDVFFAGAFRDQGAALMAEVDPASTPVAPVTITTVTATTTNDGTTTYFMNSASAQTLTIAKDLTAVPVGAELCVVVLGAGVVTLAAASGVTINLNALTLVSNGRYGVIRLIKVAANTYVGTGDLVPAA